MLERFHLWRLQHDPLEMDVEGKKWFEPAVFSEVRTSEGRSIPMIKVRDRLVQMSRRL